ncbi:hypothetical protein AB9K21_02330 [Anaplasma phagocytophilum]|uniref:Uncharacterized protein n=1 Tax=Anaplasma phagocytophilum str. ApNP TaxID=1359153 RepID=A0A0F3NI03_ANAPH|nr:hypothetical protein APHNP_0137 [Anaplasma phagocytophilum str. ApNP]
MDIISILLRVYVIEVVLSMDSILRDCVYAADMAPLGRICIIPQ